MFLKKLALTFLFALTAGSASATILTFEGLTTGAAASLNATTPNYGGFTWDNAFYLYNVASYATPVHSGSYGIVNNFGTNPVSVSSGTAFNFNGAWLNGWYFNAPAQVTLIGYDALNNVVGSITQAITAGSQVYATANFANVNRVDFVGGQYFTIDDFTYNAAQVPTPATGALLLTGLGLIGFTARRRKTL